MENQFEVRYYGTHKMLAEFARKYSIGPRWPIVIAFWSLYLFFFIFCAANGVLDIAWRRLVLLGVFMLIVAYFPHIYAWSVMRNGKKMNDGIAPETVVTFGNTIELHEGMVHLTIEYRKIVRTIRLKHSYLLMTGKRTGVMLRTDCFTKGTFEEFTEFLAQKRTDLKIVE